uniref:Alkaline ceramidase n=1 Tax=Spermophilus dauricus TaxID=99837 RepID=A0A8C9PQX9_SPEDA
MPSILAYQSSEVDWCESNFQYSQLVAEFYNTFSNISFLIFGPLMMFLMHPYAQKRSRCIYGTFVLFMIIGLFSMYFHTPLLLPHLPRKEQVGQGLTSCHSQLSPSPSRSHFTCLVIATTIISTFLSFLKPTVNAYALNSIAIHILYIVYHTRLRHLIEVSVVLWACAMTSWISDRFLCGFWQRIHFFYLHSIWHVLISITFPYGLVTMALVDASYEMPGQTLKVRYWPRDTWPMGLPYVEVQGDDKSC